MFSGSPTITFYVPEDPEVLRAIAVVSVRHAHLDYILRMTIKTLVGPNVTPKEALDATRFEGSARLRDRIRKLAKKRLGDGETLVRIQALLERARRATDRRNQLIHNIWAQNSEGVPLMRTDDHEWRDPPTPQELDDFATQLASLTNEINEARLSGFLFEALNGK